MTSSGNSAARYGKLAFGCPLVYVGLLIVYAGCRVLRGKAWAKAMLAAVAFQARA